MLGIYSCKIRDFTPMQLPIPDHREALKKNHGKNDVVARWVVPIRGKLFDIEFEHGTLSGKRVVWVNGEEVLRRDLMYRLVGEDVFHLEDKRCILHILPASGFKYTYKLFIDGVECEIYNQQQSRVLKTWEIKINDKTYRVVLERDTLNVYMNGILRDEKPEFVDAGTDTSFVEDGHVFIVKARRSSGNGDDPLCYNLSVNGAVQEVV